MRFAIISSGLQVTWAVQALLKRQGWFELPLYALGGSSGGALVLMLALRMQLQVLLLSCLALLMVTKSLTALLMKGQRVLRRVEQGGSPKH